MAGSGSTLSRRLSEVAGVGLFAAALIWLIALVSYDPRDPVWFFSTGTNDVPANFVGPVGAFIAELSYQIVGYAAYLAPAIVAVAGWFVPGAGYWLLGQFARGTTIGVTIVVLFVLGISREPTMLLALPVLMGVGITFASIALVFNALAQGYDFFTYYFTLVLTPMTFLSGVYFPIEQMPAVLQALAQVLPLTAAVELVRPLVLGEWPSEWLRPTAMLVGYAVGGYWLALVLTRRRFYG